MAAASTDPKRNPPPRPEDIELAPDAWERFTRTVRRMAETPPKPHKDGRRPKPLQHIDLATRGGKWP